MTTTYTASTGMPDEVINTMALLSFDHDYMKGHTYEHKDYYIDDTTSDSTITATSKDLLNKRQISDTNNQDWLEEIEQSFNKDNTALDDFYDHHTITQSYLEPNCIIQQNHKQETVPLPTHHYHHPPPLHHYHHRRRPSKFSAIKSKVKRVFRLSTTASKHQPSLPVFPTISSTTAVAAAAVGESTKQTWNPSIDSICSSTTTAISRPRSISSSSSEKSYLHRNSCMSSSPFTTSLRGHSTVSKLKNRFSRASSLCALPTQPPVVIKGILKKQTNPHHHHHHHHHHYHQQQQRPNSAIFETASPRQRKLCANNRFSIHGVPSPNKKRHTVLSTMMMPTKNNYHNEHRQQLQQQQQQQQQQHNGRRVRFNKFVDIHETYAKSDYDRTSDMDAVCTRLTAVIATQIKQELNNYKLHEMRVHDSSRKHTHFFL